MTDPPARDADLVAFCQAEYPRLVGMLGLYCGNRAVAEELAQETLARAWRKWPQVHHLDRPDAWARRVAINLANSHLRRVLAERRALRRLPTPDVAVEEDAHDGDVLRRALSLLPRRQRAVVILHYYLDQSLDDIANQMQTTIPAVKSLLHRAVQRLRSERRVKDLWEVSDVT